MRVPRIVRGTVEPMSDPARSADEGPPPNAVYAAVHREFPFIDATYRRRISLRPTPGVIYAEMEDYIHHFAVELHHVDGVVTAATAVGVRHPWDACPGGARGVAAMVGTPLADADHRHGWSEDRSTQCVHVVDLALVAARHAHDDAPTEFDVRIPAAARERRTAVLRRDGDVVFEWTVDGDQVVAPDRFAGMSLAGSGFFGWIGAHLDDEDEVEAATLLRRACYIGVSRGLDLDTYERAIEGGTINSSCFVYQPGVAIRSRRMVGTSRATEDDA